MVRKKRIPVDFGKYRGDIAYDGKTLKQLYEEWKAKADGLSGASQGFYNFDGSLYTYLKGHGVERRVVGNSGPKPMAEKYKLFNVLNDIEKLVNRQRLDAQVIANIVSTYKTLIELSNAPTSDANPRNMMFSDPVDFDRSTGQIIDTEPVYGHYLTTNYVDRIKAINRKRARDGKDLKTVPKPAEKEWYSPSKGSAEPPLWRFSVGPDGLIEVLEEGIKTLREADLTIDDPIPINKKRGAGLWAYDNFPEVKKYFDFTFRDGRMKNFITSSGNLSTSTLVTNLKLVPIRPQNSAENEMVKEWMDATGIPGMITKFFISVSRRQIQNIINKHYKQEFEKALKEKTSVKKSWREVISVGH